MVTTNRQHRKLAAGTRNHTSTRCATPSGLRSLDTREHLILGARRKVSPSLIARASQRPGCSWRTCMRSPEGVITGSAVCMRDRAR
jgi:hypothetical protein